MARVLVVTNDFPPTVGGIQSYVRDFLATLDPSDIVVFASTQDPAAAQQWDASAPYPIVRWPHSVMVPTWGVAKRMAQLIRELDIETVWFGAAAPLALLAPVARRAGARRVVAATHGHEVGWSMLPGARQALRYIGRNCDVITYISEYTLRRLRGAFGPRATFVRLPAGVEVSAFRRPLPPELAAVRHRFGLSEGPVVSCISRLVPRKGQDALLSVWPRITWLFPDAQLLIVGEGSYETRLRTLAEGQTGVIFTGRVSDSDRQALLAMSDVFAMPCRTRGGGLDVEGLGIVFLEAQAARVPVIAGDSGGAPETVTAESAIVVDGRDKQQLATALEELLGDPGRRQRMGEAGYRHVSSEWTWEELGREFRRVLFG